MKNKTYIIDRSTWRCGGDNGKNAKGLGEVLMKNEKGFMCCLGQCVIQDNPDKKDWDIGAGEPQEFAEENTLIEKSPFYYVEPHWSNHYDNTELSAYAMDINDNKDLTLPERESELKALFRQYGLNIKFIGKSVKYED